MAFATTDRISRPIGELNTTPLIDVLLVLLVMFIIAIPAAPHSLHYDLPGPGPAGPVNPVKNTLSVTPAGLILWNGQPVSEQALAARLAQVRAMDRQPEVQFRPDAQASYARSAAVLNLVRQSGISSFGFVGNERYRSFER